MLMNSRELGFSESEEIRTDDFQFEDNDLYLDSSEHIHDVESAGGSENFWRNWQAEQDSLS